MLHVSTLRNHCGSPSAWLAKPSHHGHYCQTIRRFSGSTHYKWRAYFMTDSRRASADALLTPITASNGSGNLFVYFKDLLQVVSIDFVALLCSIVAESQFMV